MSSSKNKVLLAIIVILLLTNIGMLAFVFKNSNPPEPPPKGPGFTERLKKEVGFSEDQMKVFEPKKKIFWTSMHERLDRIKTAKENFYLQMYDASVPDSVLVAKADAIGNQQRDLDLYVIRHFKDVRMLCTPAQLIRFDSLLPTIIHRMTEIPGRK
jgi:periplasmic protein CpxP/Spy